MPVEKLTLYLLPLSVPGGRVSKSTTSECAFSGNNTLNVIRNGLRTLKLMICRGTRCNTWLEYSSSGLPKNDLTDNIALTGNLACESLDGTCHLIDFTIMRQHLVDHAVIRYLTRPRVPEDNNTWI